jgi:hypothetical protein
MSVRSNAIAQERDSYFSPVRYRNRNCTVKPGRYLKKSRAVSMHYKYAANKLPGDICIMTIISCGSQGQHPKLPGAA